MRISIRTKSNLFLAGLLLLTVGMLSLLVLGEVKKEQQVHYESLLSQQSKVANIYINQSYALHRGIESNEFLKSKGPELANQIRILSDMQVILYNMKGVKVGNSFPMDSYNSINTTIPYASKNKVAYEVDDEFLYYSTPISTTDGQIAVVEFIYPLKENINFLKKIIMIFVYIGILVFVLSYIIGYIYFNSIVSDILKLKKHIDEIKIGGFKKLQILKRNDELKDLEQGICFMDSRIEENIRTMDKEQEQLKYAVEKLKILEKQQKRFIGNITHEFKTPLTIIRAYVDLIEMYTDDPLLLEDAKKNISKETDRLLDMVEKALHLSSLEKYDFEFNAEPIEIMELLSVICDRINVKAKKFELTMFCDLNKAYIWADHESIMQIFINILDNAIKYNKPNGQIFINNYIDNASVCIVIRDTGIGIPIESKDKIFQPFYRVDKERSRQTSGIGLGLALVKKLVEMQKGTIELMNIEEKGTSIKISFPHLL
ncbi:HAMP domain-containing histidine kinase [Clostridium estertheticum]|uniref:sensor histidine kinase n=1 Tax=Clostridium estertheticum TaxID=238834 RepID=UPI001CF233E2|nr:HAMP domain-containing sensor histidine kinase [Clostridium estertheticum]MCB2307460.1 HAMP domain-containing histidine kinase [Clostridium estertheticum]MCB2345717.1 HAMP domain-containing histidine kinase [Clostridium estertheticum]MCB2350949.1 HAMP domain-containing histidine kinase [Clostridium estertheticum]WAG44069.1 HAMP domain-containing histidine kinase [Clostridium estertheticum]